MPMSDDFTLGAWVEQLRAQQARLVMPFIGPLLDAWDELPNDIRSLIVENSDDLHRILVGINSAMEADLAARTENEHVTFQKQNVTKRPFDK